MVNATDLFAQQIKADVNIHTDKLPKEEREYLDNLAGDIEDLVNRYPWIQRGHNYEMPVRIEIFMEGYSWAPMYHHYKAGVLIATQTGIQLRDSRWDFRHSKDFNHDFGKNDDPLTNLLEFYIWICLGFELDRYAPLGGQLFYEKSAAIAENAQFDRDYIRGWDRRREFARDLTSDRYRDIRTATFHANAGIYYAKKDKKEAALSHLTRSAELLMSEKPEILELMPQDHIMRYIDINEFVSTLNKIEAYDLLERLSEWDPKHKDIYNP